MFRCSISANVLLGQCIGLLPNMLAHHSAAHQNSCYDPTVGKRAVTQVGGRVLL